MSDLEMKRGDKATIEIRDTVDKDGNPFAWTGWTVRFTAKERVSDADVDAVIAKTSATAGDFDLLAAGSADVLIVPADTDTLEATTVLHWDVQVTLDADPTEVYTLDSGTLKVAADITRTV